MEDNREPPAPNFNRTRRAIGIGICFSPVVLLVASVGAAQFWPRWSAWGVALGVLGLLVAGVNLYLGAVRPSLYRRRRGSMDGFRNVSGFPLVGTLFAAAGGLVGFGDWRVAGLGLVALALDLGGLPWFLVVTWRDQSFWDA